MADDPIRVFTALVTHPDNFAEAEKTLADLRESDWGDVPHMFIQPSNWSKSIASAAANYKRALIAAAEADCDFTLIIEDDVRVCRHLRHNLSTIPIVARRQCDYLSLFIPDLLADP